MNKYICIFILLGITSCHRPSKNEKRIDNVLLQEVYLENLKLYKSDLVVSNWRKEFKKLSIITFYEGCSTCYSKFYTWIHKMDSLGINNNDNLLIIIRGKKLDKFIEQMDSNYLAKVKFGLVIDSTNAFIQVNKHISKDFFDCSVTIDEQNKIVLVGAPFASPQMTKLYRKICSQ